MAKENQKNKKDRKRSDVAIVGVGCHFPGAKDYRQYWANLMNGVNSVREIPIERWDIKKHYSPDSKVPAERKWWQFWKRENTKDVL